MRIVQAAQHPTFADFGAATHSHGQCIHTSFTISRHPHAYSRVLALSAHHERQIVPIQSFSVLARLLKQRLCWFWLACANTYDS